MSLLAENRTDVFEKVLIAVGGDIQIAQKRLKQIYMDMYPTSKMRAREEYGKTILAYIKDRKKGNVSKVKRRTLM